MAFPLKVVFPQELRRLRLGPEAYEELVVFVRENLPGQDFRLTYEDDEGDHVTIASPKEFADAMEIAKDDQRKVLRIAVTPIVAAHEPLPPATPAPRPVAFVVSVELRGATEGTVSFSIYEDEAKALTFERFKSQLEDASGCEVTHVKYVDEEEDEVTISTDPELDFALTSYAPERRLKVIAVTNPRPVTADMSLNPSDQFSSTSSPATTPVAPAKRKKWEDVTWEELDASLAALSALGFKDIEKNTALLAQHDNDVDAVLAELKK